MKKRYTKTPLPVPGDPLETHHDTGNPAEGFEPQKRGIGTPDGEKPAGAIMPGGGSCRPEDESRPAGSDAAGRHSGREEQSIPPALVAGGRVSDDAVFRDIVAKALEGNIKYQELYLKYIDLISGKIGDQDEVIYEATFVDDKDKDT